MSSHNRKNELREQIDGINMKILALLNERATVASEIGRISSELGTAFYDPEREAAMLTELQQANDGPFSNETISQLFNQIFRATLDLEETEQRAKYLVQRKSPTDRTVITLPDGTEFGGDTFHVVAGACAVESFEQMDEVAAALKERGVKIMRGMGYKPRTSPYDFQGLGEQGLQIARQVANKHNLFVTSEVLDMSLIPMMSEYVDIFWVGARNMQNSFLLRAMGNVRLQVIIKRSFGATIRE